MGTERCDVGEYSGFRFWDDDPFDRPDLGVPSGVEPNAVISGGGDGALQDFLRLACPGKRAGEIYAAIPNWAKLWVETRVHSLEDQAQRESAWATPAHDHSILSELHQGYGQLISSLAQSGWSAIADSIRPMVGPLPKKDRLHMFFPCDHFSRCYALNRFLVLLIAEYLQREHQTQPLEPGLSLKSVTPVNPGHRCKHRPTLCLGEEHELRFQSADCRGGVFPFRREIQCNVAIMRHGIKPPEFTFSGGSILMPRQLLPYEMNG